MPAVTPAPAPFRPLTGTRPAAGLVSLALLPVLFALDQYLPLGVAAGIAYVIPVLLTLWSSRRLTLAVAGIASLLVLADLLLAPAAALNWMVALNRAMSLLMIWTTAILVLLRRHAELAVETANAALERQVQARTAHLDEVNRQLQREAAERLQIAAELRDSTERFRAMVETTSDWVWELDAQGVYTYASPKGLDILGYAPDEVLGRTPFDFMPPDEAERVGALFRSIVAGRMPFHCLENVNRHRNGHPVVLETSGVPVFDADGVFRGYRGIDRDVTERKVTERRLRESEQHLRRIIDLVPHRIFAKDDEGRFLLANRAVAEAYGMAVEDILGRHHGELHGHAQELERMRADDRAVIASGRMKLIPEETFTGADGRIRTMRTVKIPYRVPGEESRAVLGLAIDITEEKEFERRLVASERKYRALLENAVDAILLAGLDGRLVDANRRAEQLLGYTREELCGMRAWDLHPPEEHARVAEVFETLRRSGSTLVVHPVRRKDGSLIQVEVAASRIDFGDQTLLQGIFRDVSTRERRAAQRLAEEKQLRDTLVREVHHRIKNNLQGVVGLLRSHANAHPELDAAIVAAIGQVQSISVVHGLHGQGDDLQVYLCDMVCAIARNAGTLTRTRIEPQVDLAVPRPVAVDPDEAVPVALVVNELILNAVKHSAGDPQVSVRVARSGDAAEVTVTNTGELAPGFDFAAGRGVGTGLGLVRSLLPRNGARLHVEQAGEAVLARLVLAPPVVILSASR